MWKDYENFQVAAYVWAYYLDKASEEQIQRDIDQFRSYIPLKKVYLENHRSTVDVSKEKMKRAREIFEKNGIQVSGGITSTVLVDGERKPSIFDTFCYTNEKHRKRYLGIVEDLASVVDEIILDDFFFTACRCEDCIKAKGNKSWSQYRLDLMEDFSKQIVKRAKEVNPNLNFIIKYPAWYKSYHETGYNPEKQRDIFDMIYTGTETREPVYNAQHMQRYHSYSIMRFLENVAPGRNGGGWIDPYGSSDNINRYLEQAEHTMFAKAKELMLFNFEHMLLPEINALPALGKDLYRVDRLVGAAGKPIGVSVYEPLNSDGEDHVYNYLGMGGIALEPVPYFDEKASTILLTASSAKDPDILEKLEKFMRNGGNAVLTTGFVHETYDKGVRDLTAVELTGRYVSGTEYMIANRNFTTGYVVRGKEPVLFEALQGKDNANWADIAVCCKEFNCPIMTEEDYGKGRLFILNVPQNYADFYALPEKVWETIAKHLSMGQRVYVASDEKCSFFAYDNNIYGVQNYAPHGSIIRFVVRGEFKGLKNIETGEIHTNIVPLATPEKQMDAATTIPEEQEYAVDIHIGAGSYNFFQVL